MIYKYTVETEMLHQKFNSKASLKSIEFCLAELIDQKCNQWNKLSKKVVNISDQFTPPPQGLFSVQLFPSCDKYSHHQMAKNTGLLIIDIQNDYFPGGKLALHQIEEKADNCAKLLAAAREKGVPVFHVRHEAASPSLGFFLPGTHGAEIHDKVWSIITIISIISRSSLCGHHQIIPDLSVCANGHPTQVKPIEGETVVTKTEINSYKGTNLQSKLNEAGVRTPFFIQIPSGLFFLIYLHTQVENLVICGAMTHMCIDAGVRWEREIKKRGAFPGVPPPHQLITFY